MAATGTMVKLSFQTVYYLVGKYRSVPRRGQAGALKVWWIGAVLRGWLAVDKDAQSNPSGVRPLAGSTGVGNLRGATRRGVFTRVILLHLRLLWLPGALGGP